MSVIIERAEEHEKIKKLLSKEIPSYRQAYSDRTSMIMACLSELAYIKFNEPLLDSTNKKLIKNATKLLGKEKASYIYKLIDLLAYDSEKERKILESDLVLLNLKLEKTFDEKGTQAILVSSEEFYVLAFRGTEPTSIADIKSDLDAIQTSCETGGRIHRGFKSAFNDVHTQIQTYINQNLKDKPLFITGHSLGGALATVATKKLIYPQIAGCYTYGSPRIGDERWMLGIRSPVYRLVNSADPVTMLPPGSDLIDIASLLVKFIPTFGDSWSKRLESKFGGYSHVGYMRYLTNIENGNFGDARLLYSVSFLRRFRAYFSNIKHYSKIPSDHSMVVYRKKLQSIAYYKQKIN
ncbi:lipase family protein [Sulfurimonas sp.]|uniref:lipase family protein n=1 Tax=Sulfurimonas sp. TaxID=2022749 RepID=UPI0039E6FC35